MIFDGDLKDFRILAKQYQDCVTKYFNFPRNRPFRIYSIASLTKFPPNFTMRVEKTTFLTRKNTNFGNSSNQFSVESAGHFRPMEL